MMEITSNLCNMNDDDENIFRRGLEHEQIGHRTEISISNYDDFNFIVTVGVMEIFHFSSTIFLYCILNVCGERCS